MLQKRSRDSEVVLMERLYSERNVDLSLLTEHVASFFKKNGFGVRLVTEEQKGFFKVIVRPTREHDIRGSVVVFVEGYPGKFSVRLIGGARSEAFMKFGLLASLFGGGSLFLRGIKSKEALEKLERKFWVYVEEKIDFLSVRTHNALS